MEGVISAKILRIREQTEKLVDEVFHLIEMERELTDRYIRFIKCGRSYGNPYSGS